MNNKTDVNQDGTTMYVAALSEVCAYGDIYTHIFCSRSAEEVADKIVTHFKNETAERDMHPDYDRETILKTVREGNIPYKPMEIGVLDWDNYYLLTAEVLSVK